MIIEDNIKAVCFDAFGTLVEIKEKRWPYRTLLQNLDDSSRQQLTYDAMRKDMSLDRCFSLYGNQLSTTLMDALKADLQAELSSIQIRTNMDEIWRNLKGKGLKLAICSNLASPYGQLF